MKKIAIVTKPNYSSPRILANCLHSFFSQAEGVQSEVFHELFVFKRLLSYAKVAKNYNYFSWKSYQLIHYIQDQLFLRKLKKYDAVVVVECSPKAFLNNSFDFVKLKGILKDIPLIFHEVYYLGNGPTMVTYLAEGGHHQEDIFDWHLSVSEVTEIRSKPKAPWSQIGLYLKSTGLVPVPKKEHLAVIDFYREGYEEERNVQIKALEAVGIPYIELSGSYTFDEIRDVYKKATFYFLQFPESFGLPIAECMSCGAYVFTPDTSWAMAWRLDDEVQIHGPGKLADCFVVYDGQKGLEEKLIQYKSEYDLQESPKKVFQIFMDNYSDYYEGNKPELDNFLNKLQSGEL
ncbi:hypothetical protein [Cyclobacterium qasimii]|uniref:Glycosyl transferase family 1 domain-containing protein n=2 Tax=Cyclobacterium qasimii TaxID=1350429 RepID=S7VBC5_9BACT|nr:hypothetical protein [Cyclobacterium qasimii]EPR67540.1 hypothetical protein ADICYQ_3564 [Cyclobacterium qasimii M12-11B]GEO21725.1 hypothetical protein CQA01_22590 [Cyclobacterium qasimii]